MICRINCPRGIDCQPLSNVVSENDKTFVCVGLHNEKNKDHPQDRFRHCFKSAADTDTMFDYDEYDLKSVISVMSEALLIDDLSNG